jgi:hypothetical protein
MSIKYPKLGINPIRPVIRAPVREPLTFLATTTVPANAVLDRDGKPIVDRDGNYIVSR